MHAFMQAYPRPFTPMAHRPACSMRKR